MSDWTGQDYLNELASRPAARMPAAIGEIWNAEWERAGLDTISGVGKPYRDAVDDLETAIAGASGKSVSEYAFSQGVNLAGAASPDRRVALLAQLADTLPDEARKTIDPLKDVRKRAAEKAQKIEADANDVAGATYGLSGAATAFAAGIARLTADPFNLAAMVATAPIGGPLTGGAVKVIGRQALAGGVAQAVVEPAIQPARGELGLEHGADRALGNIAGAAFGGAVFSGGILGLSGLLRAGARSMRGVREPVSAPRDAPPTFEGAAPGEPGMGVFSHEDFDPFDRGQVYSPAERGPVVSALDDGPVNDFRIPSPDDMAAAAALAQRDHVIDDAAWITPKAKQVVADIAARDATLTLPVINENSIRLTSEAAALRARDAELTARIEGLPPGDASAADRLTRLKAVETQLASGPDAETARTLAQRRDELLTNATPESLTAAVLPIEQLRVANAERASIVARLDEIAAEQARLAADNLSSAPKAMLGQTELIRRSPTVGELIAHRELVHEAADAIEAGRPVHIRGVVERLRAEGVDLPEWDASIFARYADQEPQIPGWDVADDAGAKPTLGGEASQGIRERPGNADAGGLPRQDRGGAGSAGEENAAGLSGDPVVKAEAARTLDAQGGDLEITIPDENGNLRNVSARAALREAEDEAVAVKEFQACVGGGLNFQ